MNNLYRKTIISIVIVYLVILAGGIVRMTGSGMGCPDWPKCFGFLIPPTERSQLEWKSNSKYNKNQIVIINETLFYANDKLIFFNKFIKSKISKMHHLSYLYFLLKLGFVLKLEKLSQVSR